MDDPIVVKHNRFRKNNRLIGSSSNISTVHCNIKLEYHLQTNILNKPDRHLSFLTPQWVDIEHLLYSFNARWKNKEHKGILLSD
jgi:hypothetical protein